VSIVYQGTATDISYHSLITGLATTILAADEVARVQIKAVPQDTIHIIRCWWKVFLRALLII